MCGNYAKDHISRSALSGSPPRVRELLTGAKAVDAFNRITPACAGTTLKDPLFLQLSILDFLEIYSLALIADRLACYLLGLYVALFY